MKVNSHINFLKRRGILIREDKINFEKDILKEDTVTDKRGGEWSRNSPQGKMIRTKGGTVPLDTEFDWVREFIPHVPDDPKILALIQHLGAEKVIGDEFDEDYGDWYGNQTIVHTNNGEEWVIGTRTSMGNALYGYWDNYIDDVGFEGLGIDLGDYVDVSDYWVDTFCQEETEHYIGDLDDDDLVDRYSDYDILAEISDLEKEEEELEQDYYEVKERIEQYKEAIETMEIQNQDYLTYGQQEPPHSEESFELYVNKLEELKSTLGSIERKLEEIPYSKEEYIDTLRRQVSQDYHSDCEYCMQDPVYCLVHEKGLYRTETEAIEDQGFDIDREEVIRYLSGDYTNYGDMSGYNGDYHWETVGNEDYILIRIN
jgi:hypothetical protein